MDEQLLIAGCKRGESWARKQLYEIHAPVMMSVCMRYINNKETAKDILQDGFIKVFTKINTYSEIGSLGGWMRKIFVTTALEYLRQSNALKLSINIEDCDDKIEYIDTSVVDRLSAEELLSCIGELPDGFRTVFNLFAIEGYSHKEIAEMLNIKESTSRSQFVRARKTLQKNVESLIKHRSAGYK
ncbi:sigma-70 family RNA polymerase sigma factor [Dysgonomonas sp. Marseille-P4677]|uniref:RNA polymerase sigma factor n=1 Tax=Dysgonomonas sp. Marseille-P4677 TaxID=2364790 RepID=UPI001911E177|nr:sigma-70 family RNA polymerase sigma factor [Dysgonomonas sp. Marseille-P4677]MBK5720563.1 sigma-70 family RNA polymerase sigma factor [Dysgonomonas sp. Marseille-P4677]